MNINTRTNTVKFTKQELRTIATFKQLANSIYRFAPSDKLRDLALGARDAAMDLEVEIKRLEGVSSDTKRHAEIGRQAEFDDAAKEKSR